MMKVNVKEFVDSLDYSELKKMEKDLQKGGVHLKKLVDDTIKQHEKSHNTSCSVCANRIDPEDINNFTLVFGPESFKKKATFCAVDCLEFFINNLKKMRNEIK